MRPTVAGITVLFMVGFLTGGPRDAGETGAAAPATVASGRARETLRDPRIGFRRLEEAGAGSGIHGCLPGTVEEPG